jgi:hypothetical protein
VGWSGAFHVCEFFVCLAIVGLNFFSEYLILSA